MRADLESPPPRASGPLLTRSLRSASMPLYGLMIFVFIVLGGIAGGAVYARTQGAGGMSNLEALGFLMIAPLIGAVMWLFVTRPTTNFLRDIYRNGLVFPARIDKIARTSRRKVARALFTHEHVELYVLADMPQLEVRENDACNVLYDPTTGFGCVVWNNQYLLTALPEERKAQRRG